jgi:hypothetical protein
MEQWYSSSMIGSKLGSRVPEPDMNRYFSTNLASYPTQTREFEGGIGGCIKVTDKVSPTS